MPGGWASRTGIWSASPPGRRSLETPVVVQPGQAPGVLALALGYGRAAGRVADGIGGNAFPFKDPDPAWSGLRRGVRLAQLGGRKELPVTQGHHLLEGRDLVHSFSLAEYAREAGRHRPRGNPRACTRTSASRSTSGAWPST